MSGQEDRQDFKKWIIDLVFESQQGLCSRCGTSIEVEPYQIHHKNGDHSDNSLENCELYCIRCHHKTFPEDMYQKHKQQEVKVLEQLTALIDQAVDPSTKVSGAMVEKLLEAMTLSLRVSRNVTEVDYGMMRTPASVKMNRSVSNYEALADSYSNGFMDGVKQLIGKFATKEE